MPLITKLLVANRGEIARRIFAACRKMGIATVAVYSDPDRQAVFVTEADEGVGLGGAASADSYLRIEAIVEAARRSGADAIHPGYGFLAESPSFARAVIEAGLIWVGPPPSAMAIMGSKLESKRLMADSGVPILSARDLTGLGEAEIEQAASDTGYPVLVKASAGGGGKGMRVVPESGDLGEAVSGARREAEAAFGDATVFLEKYLTAPRHIEIQLLADQSGNTVPIFERECSIQRRHQKIIEEAPSVAIDAATRDKMSQTAVVAAETVGYVGAGTVEFLYQAGEFFFLEMNTRLQVEHPVTEMITGLDLVRLQLLVAMGESLPPEARDPVMTGHSIEARLYAEDPTADFLPATGRLDRVRFPDLPGLRVDSGVEDGSFVPVHYDPLLAKVVAWAPTRRHAARLLARALERAEIHGSITNRALLVRVLRHPEFLSGSTDTHFLIRHDPAELGAPLVDEGGERRAAVAAALAIQAGHRANAEVLATIPSGWRNVGSQPQRFAFRGHDGVVEVAYRFQRDGSLMVTGYDTARVVEMSPDRVGIELDGLLGWYDVFRSGDVIHLTGTSGPVRLVELPRFPMQEPEEAPGSLHAPMPATVIRVAVAEGDEVEEGQVLVVLEAMKMEHTLCAPHSGTVTALDAAVGDQVDAQTVIAVVR